MGVYISQVPRACIRFGIFDEHFGGLELPIVDRFYGERG